MPAVTENKPTAAENPEKTATDKLVRDAHIAHQKKLAEIAKAKNNGSAVVQNTNPRGRRPVRNQRRAQLPEASVTVKKHDARAAREHAGAELSKRNEGKREARAMVELSRLLKTLRAKVAAEGEDSQSVDDDGDVAMTDADTTQSAYNYTTIVETNSSTIHKQMTILTSSTASETIVETSPVVAVQSEAAGTGDDEDCPILAFGPVPEQPTELPSTTQDDSDTNKEATIEVAEEVLAFGPGPEQPETDFVAEVSNPLATTEHTVITEETIEVPEHVDEDASAEVVADDGSDLGSVGSSSIESFDVVGVSDIAATLEQVFGGVPPGLEYEAQSDVAPAEESSETVPSSKMVEIIEPTVQEIDREAALTVMTDKLGFVAGMLVLSNGPGVAIQSRELNEKLIAMHVPTPEFPEIKHKAKKFKKSVIVEQPAIADELAIDNEIATVTETDVHQPIMEDAPISTDESAQFDQSVDLPALDDTAELGPSTVDPEAKQDVEVTDTVTIEKTAVDLVVHVLSGSVSDTDDLLNNNVAISSSSDEELSLRERRHRHAGATPSPRSSRTSRTARNSTTSSIGSSASRDKAHRLIDMRNVFLGTKSQEDMINTLVFDKDDGTTSKIDVCEGFASLSVDDIECLTKKRPEHPTNYESRLAQYSIKLGTVTLAAFLRAVRFDDDDLTSMVEVTRAFKTLSMKSKEEVHGSAKVLNAIDLIHSSASSRAGSAHSRRSNKSDSESN